MKRAAFAALRSPVRRGYLPVPVEDPVLPPLVEPLPVDEPLPIPPGVRVVLESVDEPVPVLPDVPPAALELPWSRRHWSFCRPVSESQLAVLELEPAEELPEFIAPLPPLVLEPPTLEPLVPPALEPVEPPRLEPLEPLEPPTLLPDAPAALPPALPPDCAYAVIAKRAAAVAVTKSFNFMCWCSCEWWDKEDCAMATQGLCH
jgi:hypothetical protein